MQDFKPHNKPDPASPSVYYVEEQAQSLVASAPFPIGVYIGKEMRIQLANQAILDVWGKGDHVIGKLFAEILPELQNQEILQQLDHVFTTGVPFHARNQRVDLVKAGKLQAFYFNYSFTPLYDKEGKIYGVMNTGADVTDLQIAKQRIEQSEKNFRSMILQAPVAMCIMLGPQHRVEVANEPMLHIWGKPVASVMNRPIFEGLPDARNQGLEKLLDHVYATGESFTANEHPVHLLRDGKPDTVYQNFVYYPYRDSDGTILGVLAISVNVTAQVMARLQIEQTVTERTASLAEANRQLQQSNADLAQFAHIASHDLQEPLRKISTFADRLQGTISQLGEREALYTSKIKTSADRMRTLVKDLLTYAEVSSQTPQQTSRVDLNEVVLEGLEEFELLVEQKKAIVNVGKLPTLIAVKSQMLQLFGNLLSNALKYTREQVAPIINIDAKTLDRNLAGLPSSLLPEVTYYQVSVSDNGIGFSQDNAEKVFDIFHRLHSRADYEGTGIGLSLCRKIAHNHGGCIIATSTPGQGSTFSIFLPADVS